MATSYELHFEDASGADPKTCEKGGGGGGRARICNSGKGGDRQKGIRTLKYVVFNVFLMKC